MLTQCLARQRERAGDGDFSLSHCRQTLSRPPRSLAKDTATRLKEAQRDHQSRSRSRAAASATCRRCDGRKRRGHARPVLNCVLRASRSSKRKGSSPALWRFRAAFLEPNAEEALLDLKEVRACSTALQHCTGSKTSTLRCDTVRRDLSRPAPGLRVAFRAE